MKTENETGREGQDQSKLAHPSLVLMREGFAFPLRITACIAEGLAGLVEGKTREQLKDYNAALRELREYVQEFKIGNVPGGEAYTGPIEFPEGALPVSPEEYGNRVYGMYENASFLRKEVLQIDLLNILGREYIPDAEDLGDGTEGGNK